MVLRPEQLVFLTTSTGYLLLIPNLTTLMQRCSLFCLPPTCITHSHIALIGGIGNHHKSPPQRNISIEVYRLLLTLFII